MISQTDYQEFTARLRLFFIQRLPQAADADDLVQEVLLKLHQHLHQIKEPSKLLPWLFQVARHALADFYRTRPKLKQMDLDQLPGHDPRDRELNFNHEFSHCMLPMILQLPPIYADALRRVEVEGLSQKDYAAQAEISYSGAKSRLQRGRRMIQGAMQRCCQVQYDSYGNIVEGQFPKRSC